MFFEKLIPAEDRYREIEQMMTLPEIATDGKRYTALVKEYNSLTPIVEKYREYKEAKKALDDAIEMRDDSSLERELRDMADEECHSNPNLTKNAILSSRLRQTKTIKYRELCKETVSIINEPTQESNLSFRRSF